MYRKLLKKFFFQEMNIFIQYREFIEKSLSQYYVANIIFALERPHNKYIY